MNDISRLLRADDERGSVGARERLRVLSTGLREELLEHFADEQEGLFPFVRAQVPTQTDTVDRLESAHDAVCAAVVRLAHLATSRVAVAHDALLGAYECFEGLYAQHSREEAELFERLEQLLTQDQRRELSRHFQGL